MSEASNKPVIFISYAHADEPEKPIEGQIQWLSFVREYLQPAVKGGIFDLWVDRQMMGGADWDPEIEHKLRACDIFILLVSARSMASNYIVDKEIAIIRERQKNGEDVYFYPLLLTPTPDAGLEKVRDKNLRPRDAKPFSDFPYNDRLRHMNEAANEIAKIAYQIVQRKGARQQNAPSIRPSYVHISGLPETAYERLVGREVELKRLDEAWADRRTNILSLVAEGGAGKSALANEWLKRLQADSYRGAEAVLGWSFYSQGSKERATSADEFLNWALSKLGLTVESQNADAKGEAIADALAKRRVLLVLDGVEPLQHGPGTQTGLLKDLGLRALLRRFAAMPPDKAHGLIVLTTRLAIQDVARRKDSTAPVVDVDELSDEAGATLLRDNGVWGKDSELKTTSHEFGGHPLALGLLASFLKETQFGDVRRRDHIRAFFADPENPRHDHAKRVMESYEKEWLAGQPILLAIMHIVGLFDRPAAADCLNALRRKPAIAGLTDVIVDLNENEWKRAINRLREVRLLAPQDSSKPRALDAHPLVREYFGGRLREERREAWRAAHRRLYEHLCATTKDKPQPTLEDLQPLYQAVAHGCQAGMQQEACDNVFYVRISRGDKAYSTHTLGALGSDLGAIACFFEQPWSRVSPTLREADQSWLLGNAAFSLRALGRLSEALEPTRASLGMYAKRESWQNAAISASNLSELELALGDLALAITDAEQSVTQADVSDAGFQRICGRTAYANALHQAGRRDEAALLFRKAEEMEAHPLLYSLRGFQYCDLLLAAAERAAWRHMLNLSSTPQPSSLPNSCCAVSERAARTLQWAEANPFLLDIALNHLTSGRAALYVAILEGVASRQLKSSRESLERAVDGLRRAGAQEFLLSGLLTRAWVRFLTGPRTGPESAQSDLDEAFEIAEPGPMRLHLADIYLYRARLFGLSKDRPATYPWTSLDDDLNQARDLIEKCGYWRRKEELEDAEAAARILS